MIDWRPTHQKRFEAILLEIETALRGEGPSSEAREILAPESAAPSSTAEQPAAAACGDTAEIDVAPASAEAPTTGPEGSTGISAAEQLGEEAPPHEREGDPTAVTETTGEGHPADPEATAPSETGACQAESDPVAVPPSSPDTEEQGLTPVLSEQSPIGKYSAADAKMGDSDGDYAPAPVRLDQPARTFFHSLPWNGEAVAAPSPDEASRAPREFSAQRKNIPDSPPAVVPSLSSGADDFFRSLPWSGKFAEPITQADAAPHVDNSNRLQFATPGLDTGTPVDEAPTAQNMLMAGMMSAAKTSRRMKERDADTGTSNPPDPATARATEFFNHLNWKKSA